MIARILTDDGWYDSIVFAIYYSRHYDEALVFDKTYSELTRVKMTQTDSNGHTHIKVFIYDERVQDWVKRDEGEGYDWILSAQLNDDLLAKCKRLQEAVTTPDMFDLNDDDDIRGLMSAATGFHDSYVSDMYNADGKQYIEFAAWGAKILFELEGNVETNLTIGYGHEWIDDEYPLIFDCSIFKENGRFCWVDWEEIKSFDQLFNPEYKERCFIADKVKWRLTPVAK